MSAHCWACLFMACVLLAGCGAGVDGPPRYKLSGKVTFDGKPVPKGEITFSPAEGNEGPGTSAQINNGEYTTPETMGTIGGPHVVRISGHQGSVAGAAPAPGASAESDVLFKEYETSADLPKSNGVMDFEVPGS